MLLDRWNQPCQQPRLQQLDRSSDAKVAVVVEGRWQIRQLNEISCNVKGSVSTVGKQGTWPVIVLRETDLAGRRHSGSYRRACRQQAHSPEDGREPPGDTTTARQ